MPVFSRIQLEGVLNGRQNVNILLTILRKLQITPKFTAGHFTTYKFFYVLKTLIPSNLSVHSSPRFNLLPAVLLKLTIMTNYLAYPKVTDKNSAILGSQYSYYIIHILNIFEQKGDILFHK